jgi:hypothetical protein
MMTHEAYLEVACTEGLNGMRENKGGMTEVWKFRSYRYLWQKNFLKNGHPNRTKCPIELGGRF